MRHFLARQRHVKGLPPGSFALVTFKKDESAQTGNNRTNGPHKNHEARQAFPFERKPYAVDYQYETAMAACE
jgi:hypothetical protein